ncbi:MAG: DUF3352 domain-containing protein [Planctomycetales bacterium]|nr:DUF3352 domain-containing protein [Planctomycetales bacterium]MBN8626110.1 DUF3352 domain-containing protein [Planctomycetota bacterium]
MSDKRRLLQRGRKILLAAFVTSVLAPAVAFAAPTLSRLVPADIGLCVEAEGLHAEVEEFLAGPLFERWRAFPPLAQWQAEQRAHLAKFNTALRSSIGVSWDDLRSRLFGREWLLAVYPPSSQAEIDEKRPPTGFLIVRAADEALLAQAVEKLLAAQRKSGKYAAASSAEFSGKSYAVHELKDDGGHSLYLVYQGEFGCLATSREKLEEVLDRHSRSSDEKFDNLAASPGYVEARRRSSSEATLRLFVQAQSWQPFYQQWLQSEAKRGDAAARKVGEIWSYLRYVSADVVLNPTVRVDLHVAWDTRQLSVELRDVLKSKAGADSAASRIPADCLAAVCGKLDLKRAADLVVALAKSESERRGKAVPTEVLIGARLLGSLGPEFVAYAVPSGGRSASEEPRNVGPVQWVVGFDTQPLLKGEPSLADAIDPIVRLGLILIADAYNAEAKAAAKIESTKIGDVQTTGITGIGPFSDAGFFVGRHDQRLWFGGTPQTIADAAAAKPSEVLEDQPLFQQLRGDRSSSASQFVFVNFLEVRGTVETLMAGAAAAAAANAPSDGAMGGLLELNALLSLADGAILEAELGEAEARLSLAVGVASPEME